MAKTNATAAADAEDDEWGPFGDFSFAPPSINATKNNIQNDDEWGDFVESPLQSSSSSTTNDNKISDINGSNYNTNQQQQWVKAKGALPLSLFGIEEEEEQEQEQEQQQSDVVVDGKNANGYLNNQSDFMNLAGDGGVAGGCGINDILASLYSQKKNDENDAKSRDGLGFEFHGAKSSNEDSSIVTDTDRYQKKNDENDEVDNGLKNSYLDVLSSSHFGGWDLEGVIENNEVEDDDGWEFKDAYSESKVENGSGQGNVAFEFPGFSMQAESKSGQEMQGQNDPVAMSNGIFSKSDSMTSKFHFNSGLVSQNSCTSDSYGQTSCKDSENGMNSNPPSEKVCTSETYGKFDLFAESNGITSTSQDTDVEFSFMNGMVHQDAYIKNGLESHPLDEISDLDETFGDFEAAVLDTASKEDVPKEVNDPPAKGEARSQGNEMRLEKRNGPVPLSIFGGEELETDTSLNIEDVFVSKQTSYSENIHNRDPSLSITDLLSNLYSQADSTRVDSMHIPTENGLAFTNGVDNSDFLVDDDFEDDSWEFKNADSQVRANNDACPDGGDLIFSTSSTLDTYVDFYSKLKDKLSLVSQCHLDRLKKARSTAAVLGAVDNLAALDEEIQDACTELAHENIIYKEMDEGYHTTRDTSLKEFIEALRELKFQALNSEFELSEKLQLAEMDLKSAIELIKHSTLMMNILTLLSMDEQHSYVSAWFKMISVCTQELKHGVWIWKRSLEKNVNSQILSEPQGKRFILALGEIYRVVLVLRASVRLYKPWILSSSVTLSSIYALLEECEHLWSSSRLEEAIHSISELSDSLYYGTVDVLLASIKHIHDTDPFALENHIFVQQKSRCMLSCLTPELVPGMKIVVWNGEQYFLTLVNMWANLISCNPPKLQRLKVG